MSYGGIRSPDCEIVFQTSEALVSRGTFALEHGLEGWTGFGISRGVDGREYSVFGPGQSLAAAPLVDIGQRLAARGTFTKSRTPLPVSFQVAGGLNDFVRHRPGQDRNVNGIRWVAAQFNVIVSTLSVVLFFVVVMRLVGSLIPAVFASVMFGFATLTWPYAGTFFSEPLAGLMSLAALGLLMAGDPDLGSNQNARLKAVGAGLCLGLAAATHVTAALFAPFFLAYAAHGRGPLRPRIGRAMFFLGGLGVVIVLLGWYNAARFGSVFETGRTAENFIYGVFTNPLRGFAGLLISPNKGLLWFCPLVWVAAFAWRRFDREHAFLARMLLAAAVFRMLFIASRSDWSGGFSLGPRFLVLLMPYACFPVALLARDALRAGKQSWRILMAVGCLLIAQQYYFSLGEIFSFYYQEGWRVTSTGVTNLPGDWLYWTWGHSSLVKLLPGFIGSFALQQTHLGAWTLFIAGCVVIALVGVVLAQRVRITPPAAPGA